MTMLSRQFQKSRSVAIVAMGNLIARWPRAAVATIAVILGVALVTAVTTGYASARQTILDWNYTWIGHSHIHLQPIPGAMWADPRMPQSLADQIGGLDAIKSVVTRQKENLLALAPGSNEPITVFGYGIQVAGEKEVRGAGIRLQAGRMLEEGSSGEVLIEQHLAEALGAGIGDTILLMPRPDALKKMAIPPEVNLPPLVRLLLERISREQAKMQFRVVGIISRPRLSTVTSQKTFQLRDLVMLTQQDMLRLNQGNEIQLETIDVILKDERQINVTAARIRRIIADYNKAHPQQALNIEIATADEKLRQLDRNMELFRLISRTVSVVALLTAAYIIFTTLGMGMVQRQVELGMLRSVGAARSQIALATFAEALPIAVVGVALGLGGGLAATKLIINYYPQFFSSVVVSESGLLWAAIGGFVAVMAAVALPAWLASRTSPLAALRPQTRRISMRLDITLAIVGALLVGGSFLTRTQIYPGQRQDQVIQTYLVAGVPMLFLGYFLAAPLLVGTVGRVLKFLAAGLLLVRPRLLDDQMQTARWRTAATACALMVGVSMLVNLRVHSESVIQGWKLPTEMPPGFVFFFDDVGREKLQQVSALPQIRQPTPMMTTWVRYHAPGMTGDDSIEVQLLAGPLNKIQSLMHLSFVEVLGDNSQEWAIDQVENHHGLLVTREFATRHGIELNRGPKERTAARLWRHEPDKSDTLKIVAIVDSPTLDLAIDFLNLRDRYQYFSSGTIIGSVADANRILSAEHPQAATVPDFDTVPVLTRILLFDFAEKGQADHKKQLEQVAAAMDRMHLQYYAGSLADLQATIVGEFRSVVSVLQQIALWAMAIASLGVGFSMAANVQSRRRQLAVLRAIGMTRFQLARVVLAEAVIIALLGSLLGIVQGLNLSLNAMYFDQVLLGLRPELTLKWFVLGLAISFAILCCLVASLVPAMRAGRTNVLAAMRQL